MVEISQEDIKTYQEDGVVCLRGVFDNYWLDLVSVGIEAALKTPGPNGENFSNSGEEGAFFGDLDMWHRHDEFMEFNLRSPAAEIASKVMESEKINFFYDQMFVKEKGTNISTPWHQDQPYWAISGRQISSLWLPLDPVSKDGSLELVAGSHNWGVEYNPQHFSNNSPYENTGLPEMPDIEGNRDEYNILSWDTEPGDCIIFQAMTVHGAKGNSSPVNRRRVLSTRWAGDDTRYAEKEGEVAIPTFETYLKHGDKFEGATFPQVWPK